MTEKQAAEMLKLLKEIAETLRDLLTVTERGE